MNDYTLELYISGDSAQARTAPSALRKLLDAELKETYHLQVIDVLENPELAEKEKILATPTLIKRAPPPVSRLVGDMSHPGNVRSYLEITTP